MFPAPIVCCYLECYKLHNLVLHGSLCGDPQILDLVQTNRITQDTSPIVPNLSLVT
jgi:hypothetical protein